MNGHGSPTFRVGWSATTPSCGFPGLCHSSVAPTLPARYLDSGLYHLVHLLSDRQERERKVERYRGVDAGASSDRGGSLSVDLLRARASSGRSKCGAVISRDRAAIEAVLSRPGEGHALPDSGSPERSASLVPRSRRAGPSETSMTRATGRRSGRSTSTVS